MGMIEEGFQKAYEMGKNIEKTKQQEANCTNHSWYEISVDISLKKYFGDNNCHKCFKSLMKMDANIPETFFACDKCKSELCFHCMNGNWFSNILK